ncbi:endonuclease 8-like 1 isoform X1 [Monodelphis domestica]|uniref:Endonuclease 8-like 1 n=2 Tax=Monodelphis domestica TaxID=13616 RepID=F7BQ63_MONDO|nr:endonuclease 8-like 1 isoform X1 [Monodelphis domestica]
MITGKLIIQIKRKLGNGEGQHGNTLSPASRMPEGPELYLASCYVNSMCKDLVFAGPVEKSEVSRNPEVPFESSAYRISATSRGKEVRLTLSPLPKAHPPQEPLDLVFRFGMSGSFQLVPADALPKHAHLRFYTISPAPRQALCFVDVRRFGHWEVQGTWQPGRGPCVLQEYEKFRENVLQNLANKTFDKPICEALLEQRFFNGIGNYLRAEILYRLKIPPFEKARTVLEALKHRRQDPELTLSKKIKAKLENPDLLELCHSVPMEVIQLGGKGYGPDREEDDFAAFRAWLRCYSVPGMSSLQDRHGRTIWFQGDPGPLAPKGRTSRKKRVKEKSNPEVTDLEDSVPVPKKKGPNRARKPGKKKPQKESEPEAKGKVGSTRGPKSKPQLKASAPTSPGDKPGVLEGKQRPMIRKRTGSTRKRKANSKASGSPSSFLPLSQKGDVALGSSPA